jgi:hypothetical protein
MKVAINTTYGGFGLSEEAVKMLDPNATHYWDLDLERHDPRLIEVIETIKERADGSCASLGIVEIPDGAEYMLDEYDGSESIHTYISVTPDELRQGLSEEKVQLALKVSSIRIVR